MAECVTIIGTIAGKIAGCLFDPIKSELSYMLCYRDHMEDLKKEVQELKQENDDLQITVAAAIRRGDEIRPIVKDWLDRAEKNTGEAETFMQDEKKRTKSCFNGRCPNLKSRYDLGKEAKKKAAVIVEIRKKRIFPHGVSFGVLPGNLTSKNYEAFESRASTLDKVMAALRDDKIKRIGVWGLGGVGKTTLVKQVAKLAEDAKLFDKVVMVAVSREQNLENIQAEIADSLGLNIEEKSKSGRANRLIEILKKKKLLIILDDIWAKLDLEAVGIPCGDDHVGCKIVVTSRRIDVLSQDMGTQPNFEIRILSNDEAWQLFQKTAGGIPEFDVQSVARKVAENCGGLPIALVTVATALKNNKSLPCWDDALRQLTSPVKTDIRGMDEKVYKSLEWSYHSVESEDAKLLFLLCGLMGYGDISLDDLFKCSLGLGLFQGINTLDGSTNRLQALVDRLKSSSLLLDIDRKEYVKMHDVVRDVARQLASKDPRYMVIEATQSGIHESKRCVHLSLSHEGTLDLGEILDRPKIEFFRLVNEGRPLKIPDPLFNGMGKLKVLHLFQMEFSSLPLSLQSLANLRTLCLHCCTLGGVAGIGELKKLEVLSFWGSKIKQLPSEIAQLTCLRWLDLSNCYQLQVIPPNILSNLSQLEHLCMKPYSFTQYMDEEINQERNACLAELKHLSRLTTLNIALQDLKLLPKDMVFDKLTRFKIFIGGGWSWYSPCETKRALKLYKAGGTLHLVDGIGKLLKKTEELSLSKSSGTKSVFHESYKEDFLQLKHLDVRSSPEIQYIVDSKYPRVQEHVLFPLLESLLLRDLINLEKVCHGPIPRGSFGNLKTLEVMNCHGLKIFLSLTMATGFLHLQNIEIGECNVMQQIIAYERESEIIEDGHGGTTLQLFPKLRSLKLYKLPELMNFSSTVETTSSTSLARNARSEGNCDNRMSFFSNQVSFANLEKLILHDLPKLREIWHHQHPPESFYNLQILEVYNCPSLLNLIPSHLIQRFNNLKKMDVNNCEVLKHVFDLQGLDENIRILPRLESLQLNSLPKLRRVVCNEDDDKNDSVRCRFSSSTAFHNLKFLSITNCGNQVEDEGHINTPMEDVVLFDGKVSFANLEKLILHDLPKLREIWHHQHPPESFYNLQILEVYNCPSLVNLIPSHLIQRFDNLKKMDVNNCEVLKHVFDLQGLDENIRILPRLESLQLNSLPKLRRVVCNEDDDKNDSVRCRFSSSTAFHNLKFLSIRHCGNQVEDEGHINTPMEDVVLFDGKVSFANLEKLILHDLPKLREIWHHQHPPESFYNLQILEVYNCPSLLNLIPSHLIQRFNNLKKMDVNNYEVLKHVFDLQGLDENIRILPRLESLWLKALPKLRRVVCNEDDDKNDSVRCRFSSSTTFHNLKFLSITNCGNQVEDEGHINTPMEDVVLFDGKVSFANLEELILHDLHKLREIWHHQHPPESFYNLQILEVYNCPSLVNLIPSHLIQRFDNLKKMDVNNCEVLKHVFDLQGLDENIRILPRLESLRLNSLPKLRRVVCNEDDDKNDSVRCRFSSSTAFHNLKFLSIRNCGNQVEDEGHINTLMEDVVLFDGKVSFPPNLEELVLERLPKLKEMDVGILLKLKILKLEKLPRLRLTIASMFKNFHNLQKLHIIDCGMEDREFSNEKVSFPPNLEELVLKSLPKLMEMDVGNLPNLRILWLEELYGCLLSKVSFLPNLKVLVLKSLPKLIEMDVGNLPNLRILNLEKLHGCLLSKVSLSSNLEEVVLKSLPKLKEIDFGILPKLKILKVGKLPQLVLSSSMFKNFHNLKELCINASTNDKVLFNEKASFLEPRASTLNKIMDALRDHNINLIGVWGMAGVGKTTLLKQVAKQAKQQRLFTRQVHIDLSSIPGSEKLRQRIAKALGIPLWEEVESRRADELKQALKEEKILIILDDIWTEVDLEQVGIPSKDDIWTQCKIVLASRDRDLLCKGMGAQICFPVEYLPLKEAWSLFKKTAGDSMEENLELRPIAIQVVEECEGLPIAIVTIAEALKDETVAVWKNALEQLRSCAPTNIRAVDRKVYSCLEWSYTHLKGDDVKSLFLLCGMLGYGDISLDLLLRYGMGLDLFDRIDSLEQARNRLLELVDFLKASGLLLDSHEDRNKFDEERASSWLFMDADNKFVRMHSVVREVTRAIASKDPHPFVVREDVGLEEWSETDESKRCAFISLHCKAVHELPQGLVCPDLQFFQLHNSNPSLNIPNTFFKGMKKLKILDLPKTHFTTLPSSLDSLTNLQTLHLDGCKLEDIALIGKLTKLEVLSLMGSTIQQLPNEMSRLTNLRLLDLNDCKKLEVIPRNILSSLSQLECLYMKSSFTQWATEGESNACLSELNHLSHLTTLEIHIPDAKLLPKDILFENLTRYGISIGPWWRLRTKRALNLEKVNRSLHLGDGMSKLLERSEELKFMDLSSTKYVLHPSDRESFLELKHLEVGRSPEIQYIMDSKNQQLLQHGAFPFPLLESLILVLLKNLEEVWHSPIPIGFFGNLKTLKVYSCPKLKFLLLLSTARGLSQLEEMIIVNCNAMKQIIAYERESEIKEDGHAGTNLQLFPKLRSLELNYLSQLINFSSELETTSSTSLSTNARSEDSFFSHKVHWIYFMFCPI
ncbi:uncharacterized protein LOC117930230 isoform X2 [Vitis riparia]|uniref:uncharacterized protein LOC117930230 isoform X2 n=1 Tax=Vitis riparia TaxID=96939 RepID=UPI00155AAAE3|nr:uncharacterized protein LOC117930230 isoform X2 [Vitis riparia]